MSYWVHSLQNLVSARVTFHWLGSCGAFQRSSPTGGFAYGIAFHAQVSPLSSKPSTGPYKVRTMALPVQGDGVCSVVGCVSLLLQAIVPTTSIRISNGTNANLNFLISSSHSRFTLQIPLDEVAVTQQTQHRLRHSTGKSTVSQESYNKLTEQKKDSLKHYRAVDGSSSQHHLIFKYGFIG